MIGIVTRKTFWDFWDNIVLVFVGNLVIVAALLGLALGLEALSALGAGAVIAAAFAGLVVVVLMLAVFAAILCPIVRRAEFHARDMWRNLASVLPGATFIATTSLGLLGLGGLVMVAVQDIAAIPRVAVTAGALWAALVWAQIALFSLVALAAAPGGLRPALRRAGVLVLDNPGYCAAVSGFGLLLLAFTVIVVPGPGAVLILFDNALTLRQRKYAGGGRGPVDWNALLAEEQRMLAQRTPRNILFPWRN